MISKTMLKIDIIGQTTIIGLLLLACIFEPDGFFIYTLMTFFFLGLWQFCNGLIAAIFFKNKTRQKYIFVSIAYIIGFIILVIINNGFIEAIENYFMLFFSFSYIIGGCLAFASWYYYQTYKELSEGIYQHPRSFWDYEF